MRMLRGACGTAKADFLERVRRFSFFAFAAFLVFTVFWFMPGASGSGFSALVIEPEHFRQGSDPSWIPMTSAMCGGMLLCPLGFAYVKNSVRADRELGVFSLVQVSPMKRGAYLFGKFLSGGLTLLVFLGVMAAAAFATMEIRFPGRLISLYAFFSPFLCVVPGLFFVSAFAVFTDCAPGFRGSSGLSAAVFLCFFIAVLTLGSLNINPRRLTSVFDFSGYLWMRRSISDAAQAVTGQPTARISVFTAGRGVRDGADLRTLVFGGVTPSADFLADKAVLAAFSLLLVFLAARMLPVSQKAAAASAERRKAVRPKGAAAQAPVLRFGLVRSEGTILLGSRPLFWWVAAAGFWAASCFSPMDTACGTLFPLAFAWMLPAFSPMGCLERQTGMDAALRTVPGAFVRQAAACWRTGLAVSVFTALPVLLRLLFAGRPADFTSALAFAVLVPAAALFFGEWSGTGRPFEILHLIFCFLLVNMPSLVFTGAAFSASSVLRAGAAAAAAAGMLLLTFAKRLAPRGVP